MTGKQIEHHTARVHHQIDEYESLACVQHLTAVKGKYIDQINMLSSVLSQFSSL